MSSLTIVAALVRTWVEPADDSESIHGEHVLVIDDGGRQLRIVGRKPDLARIAARLTAEVINARPAPQFNQRSGAA